MISSMAADDVEQLHLAISLLLTLCWWSLRTLAAWRRTVAVRPARTPLLARLCDPGVDPVARKVALELGEDASRPAMRNARLSLAGRLRSKARRIY
jgi:hypothetical protein